MVLTSAKACGLEFAVESAGGRQMSQSGRLNHVGEVRRSEDNWWQLSGRAGRWRENCVSCVLKQWALYNLSIDGAAFVCTTCVYLVLSLSRQDALFDWGNCHIRRRGSNSDGMLFWYLLQNRSSKRHDSTCDTSQKLLGCWETENDHSCKWDRFLGKLQ